jgi:2-oxoisovalerate dehydrogenase E1 component
MNYKYKELLTNNFFDTYSNEIIHSLIIREVENKLLELFSQGKLFGTVHTCIGQEFIGVAVANCLSENDSIFSNHRGHGHFIAYTQNLVGLIGEVMGKSIGVCGGRGGSQHLYQKNFFSNGIQGGIVPVSAGIALAHKLLNNKAISVVFIGDGTLGEGVLYETLNIVSKWQLPHLIICENNSYSQSTSQNEVLSGSITARAASFGIETVELDTWNYGNLIDKMKECVDFVRNSNKPLFCKVNTYRLMAHSKGDDNRDKNELKHYWDLDPLNKIKVQFENNPDFIKIQKEITIIVNEAVDIAEQCDYTQIIEPTKVSITATEWNELICEKERIVTLINRGLTNGLENDNKVVIIGEDIKSPYGGAFKCTVGLSDKYPDRVFNTPISEAAITGVGNGLALFGFKPVIEIMFGDFMTLVADQWINHASKFKWMYNDQVKVPLIIRTPMGGNRGYGPTHSQSLEKHFIGVPDTRVLCINHRYSPEILYKKLFELSDIPTLVIENKVLYSKYISTETNLGFSLYHNTDVFPTIHFKPKEQAQITFIAIGGVAFNVEECVYKLFEEEEIIAEIFMPTQLYPFNTSALIPSVLKTKKVIIVEEGQGFVSISSEIITQIAEKYPLQGITFLRIVSNESHIPTSRPLEEATLINTQKIYNKSKEFFYANP